MRLIRLLTFLYFTLSFLFFQAAPVNAAVLFSNDFNDENLDEWHVVRNFQWINPEEPCEYLGNPALWNAIFQMIGIEIWGPGCLTEIVTKDFWLQPGQSFRYEFDMLFPQTTAMDRHYTLRYIDQDNNFGIKILGSSIYIEKRVGGMGRTVPGSSTSFPFQADQTYHIVNEIFNNHQITISIDGNVVLNFMDTTPFLEEGAVGFRASVGGYPHSISWFDNAKVSTIGNDIVLDVPYVSQKDPSWANIEYDKASSWTSFSNTIKSWGCALTSAVMVLKYHGVEKTPENNDLSPESLNSWLNKQPDGYLGNGQLNWLAVSRMTSLVSKQNQDVPVLEHSRDVDADIDSIKDELDEGRPVIIHVPGHFVVAHGFDEESEEVLILDPYDEDKQYLSEFESYDQTRTFVPSHTDLSYLLLAYDPKITVTLDSIQDSDDSYIETIQSKDDPEILQEDLAVIELASPETKTYLITVEDAVGKFQFPIFAYQQDGQLTPLYVEGYSDGSPSSFLLTYNNDEPSFLEKSITSESLLPLLKGLWKEQEIKRYYPYWKLLNIAQYLALYHNDNLAKDRYVTLLESLLDEFQEELSEEAYTAMQEFLLNMR